MREQYSGVLSDTLLTASLRSHPLPQAQGCCAHLPHDGHVAPLLTGSKLGLCSALKLKSPEHCSTYCEAECLGAEHCLNL